MQGDRTEDPLGEHSIADDNIIFLLHRLKAGTLCTCGEDFFKQTLSYIVRCCVRLDVAPEEAVLLTLVCCASAVPHQGKTHGDRRASAS